MSTKFLLSICLIITVVYSQTPTGLKVSVNDSFTKLLAKALLPELSSKIKHIEPPNKKFSKSGASANFKNMKIDIPELTEDNIEIKFSEPSKIIVDLHKIKAKGQATVTAKYKLVFTSVSLTKTLYLTINQLDCTVYLNIVKSSDGKPFKYEKIDIHKLNFDYHISGMPRFIESWLKSPLRDILVPKIEDNFGSVGNRIMNMLNEKIPSSVSIDNNGYLVTLGLLENPKIANRYLTLNFDGKLINKNYAATKNPSFAIPKIKNFESDGKQFQFIISDYVFKTAINTLKLTGGIEFVVNLDMIKSSKISLDLKSLNNIFPGLSKKYTDIKNYKFLIKFNDVNTITFKNNLAKIKANIQISLRVIKNEVVTALTDLEVEPVPLIISNQKVSFKIAKTSINNTKIKYNEFKISDLSTFEQIINLLVDYALPKVNDQIKEKLTFALPSWKGLTFADISIDFRSGYVAIQYNMKLENKK